MFQRFHEMKERDESGFTLIELLVVILIIAILAAIAIPVFLRQREKGWVAQSQSGLKNAATAAESYATGANGSYVDMTKDLLVEEDYNEPVGVTVTIEAKSATGFCLEAAHASLAVDHEWKTSHYASDVGEPVPDACPAAAV